MSEIQHILPVLYHVSKDVSIFLRVLGSGELVEKAQDGTGTNGRQKTEQETNSLLFYKNCPNYSEI